MREFTKSFFSFSWATYLFGIQQTANLLSPEKAVKAFDSVTQATQGNIDGALKSTFEAGDKLQRNAVDMTHGFLSTDALNPTEIMRMASDAMKQSAEAVTKGVQGVTSTVRQATASAMPQNPGMKNENDSSSVSEPSGWGPAHP